MTDRSLDAYPNLVEHGLDLILDRLESVGK
jgi:hypothetical protein